MNQNNLLQTHLEWYSQPYFTLFSGKQVNKIKPKIFVSSALKNCKQMKSTAMLRNTDFLFCIKSVKVSV